MSFDKVLVVASAPIGSFRDTFETPKIQTSLKGLVFLTGKVARHDFRTKLFLVMNLEAVASRKPGDNVRFAVLFGQVKHFVKFPRKLQELTTTAVSTANASRSIP